jgi:hypothetical protein
MTRIPASVVRTFVVGLGFASSAGLRRAIIVSESVNDMRTSANSISTERSVSAAVSFRHTGRWRVSARSTAGALGAVPFLNIGDALNASKCLQRFLNA